MSRSKGPDEGHDNYVSYTAMVGNDIIIRPMPSDSVSKNRQRDTKACDEIHHPIVSHAKAAEMAERIEVRFQDSTKLAPELIKPAALAETIVTPRRRGMRVWGSRLATVFVALVAVVAVVLVGLRLAGFRTFTVMSGSMEPEYPVGSLIYVRSVDYHNLQVGDVISYVANDEKTVVTHRIVGIEVDEKDASILRFKTKGDANSTADSNLVHYKNVLGVPMMTIPFIGVLAHNIQQPPGIYITLVVGTLLLAWTFLPGTLEERRKTARKSVA